MILLPREIYQILQIHLQACYPEEGCGLLAGDGKTAVRFYPVENELHSQTRYKMAPVAQIAAMLDIEDRGWNLLAIVHSHPHSAPYPSAIDVAEAAYPSAYTFILSLATNPPTHGLFQIKNGQISAVECAIV